MYQVDILVDVLKNNYSQFFFLLQLDKYFVYSLVSNKSNGTLKNNQKSKLCGTVVGNSTSWVAVAVQFSVP